MHSLRVPRHACSPRDVARAGELWRLVQEVAILDATEAGWPPSRFREVGTGFVVRSLVGVHRREARYGDLLHGFTAVSPNAKLRPLVVQAGALAPRRRDKPQAPDHDCQVALTDAGPAHHAVEQARQTSGRLSWSYGLPQNAIRCLSEVGQSGVIAGAGARPLPLVARNN